MNPIKWLKRIRKFERLMTEPMLPSKDKGGMITLSVIRFDTATGKILGETKP
jgi:hypothetical protein